MASRRQRQFDRKYSSLRRYTATEDVNYNTHSARSSFRSESTTSRTSSNGRSSSTEVVSGSDTRSLPVYIAIQDYVPETTDGESIPLEQGQIVEVLDNKNPASWLVKTKARPPRTGWVPGSYFETPTEFYKQRRRTRELMSGDLKMTDEQEAIMKRDQVYHDLLHSEEEFVAHLRAAIDNYVAAFESPDAPEEVKSQKAQLALNLKELYNFHANVMLKGLQYYSDDPGKVGQTFVRLQKDFDHHVRLARNLPEVLKILEASPMKEYLENLSDRVESGNKNYIDYLNEANERMKQYEEFFKEFIKYSSRASCNTGSMQKALELIKSVPRRTVDMDIINNIKNYPGDKNRLGHLYRHDFFQVWEGEGESVDRYVFLFKNKVMITDKVPNTDPEEYKHFATLRLDKYTVREYTITEDTVVLRPNEPGLPMFRMKAKDQSSAEYVFKGWMKDMIEMQEDIAAEKEATESETLTTTEFDVNMSDVRSEFSEYSTMSRKSSLYAGPEEGPPRKKIKSPPVISPTGSSTSLYSGGSSSIDWTTTGTTLEMQGTRVTRTQYGFRTLQESSAKMCLKVTGYPLPDITWYKDDQLLSEDERHTFYADEDGFFAMTIDPVQVEDTGRYTCMATNEYGQASTSAFFRVLKVEKEAAPPKFMSNLKDQEVKEGETVNFECEVEGWPEPELLWLVDDQPLRPSHDFRLEYDGQSAKLEIRDAQPEDTGTYAVKITNEYGEVKSNAQLTVQPDPDKNHIAPEFQAVIEDVECDEGDEVRFKAVLTGDPDPQVTWYVNGVPLSESDKVKFISEDGICILTIKDVTRHFDGIVTCQGLNRLGTTSCEGRLKVRVPPQAPEFNRPLEDKMITEKSTVVFECDVSGFPDPVVEFFLNGKKLSTGEEDVEITVTDGFYRIEIKNCMIATHDGEILARASNEHGQAESRARLTVEPEDEESRSAPTFIKDIEDQTVKSGEVATFETSVRGCPTPEVTWYLNGHQLNRDSPGVEIAVTNCDHKVTIDSATYAGTILCRAENTVGRYETKARLIVLSTEPKKKAPAFKQPLVNVSEIEESTAVFEVTVDAEPKATLKWTLNGEEIKESSRFQFREFDGSSKLEIHEIKLEESGTLRCTATNSEGEAISECQFTVTRKSCGPKFKEGPKTITIEQGSEAIFEAWADAMPPATYQWSIDGKKVWNSTEGTRVETIENRTKLIIDTTVHRESLTVSVIAENPHGMDESGARLIVEEKKVEDKKATQEETTTRTETTTSHVAEEGKTTVYQESITEHHEEHYVRSEPQIITTTTVSEEHVTTSSTTHGEISVEPIVVGGDVSLHETTKTEERVTVSGQPVLKIGLKDISVMQGEEAKFTTVIESVTEKVEWFLDDKKLEPTQTGVTMTQEASEYNLALDSKIYQSGTVSAKSGDTVTTAQFDVKEAKVEEVAQKAPETPVEKIAEQKEVPTEKAPEIHIPEFSERLTDIKVVEGEHFELRVTASDKPSFKWTLNGQPMHDGVEGVHIVDDGNKSTLSVDEAAQKHSGKVSVTAENEAGKAESSANITIELKATKPEIVSGPTDKTAQVGDRVEFVAKVRAQPETTVTWNVNGRTVDSTIHSGEDYKLIIESVEEFNSGTVTVTATNSAGSVDHKSQLKVEKPEVRPEFTKGSQEQEVNEGEPMKFEVTLNQAPSPDTKISWYINNTKLMPSDDVKIVDNGDGTLRVEIAKAKPEMTGVLKCKAENSKGSDETTAKVTVKPARAKPSFAKSPQDHTDVTTEEESVKFSAIVVGNPTPEVTWYLNNEKIVSSEAIRVKYEETSGKTSIRIFGPNVEQSGTVKVVASNDVGSVEATANLKITKKTELPRFVTVMNDKQLNEGEIATFKATIAAFPEPEVVWSLNGEPLKPSENVIITNVGDQHNLELKNIVPEQTGEISCTATNAAGFKKQNASLIVKEVGEAPTFVRNLEDRLVEEKEVLIMEAKLIQVKPKPTVSWYRDGKPLESDDHWRLSESDDGTLQLKIISTELTDKSRITIKAENKWGSAECSASIGVTKKRMQSKPAFQSDLAPITLNEGDSLKTKLIVTGDPEPYAKWYINNQMVYPTEDTEIKNENGVYSLTIHGVTTDMTGKIKCTIGNRMGEATTEGQLTVIQPIPVAFETVLCDATCREGDTLKLKAVLLGEPMPDVTWFVNGRKLEETQNIKIHAEKGTYTVTIKDITCDYSGKVVCEAVNEFGKASSEAMLLVLPRGEPPDFLEWLSNVRARQGSKVVHKVVFTGDPKPNLTWYINNKEVTHSEEISIVTDATTSILTINNFNPEKHVGEIICKAENEAGEVSCTANMGTYTSDMFSESESEAMAEENLEFEELTETGTDHEEEEEIARTPTPIMAPKFITKIKDTKAKKGHQAIFECVVPDTKGVCCKWLKDGKEIELIARIRVQTRTIEGHTTNELIIDEVIPEDAGKYTVIVENRAGTDTCEATLQVVEMLEKPEDKQPEFVVQLKDKSVKATEKVTFECKVVGTPEPHVSWYHGDEKLEEIPKKVIIEADDSVHRLVIESTEVKDEGTYSCVAENSAGTTKSEATLQVLSEPPSFTKSLQDKSVKMGDKIILDCSVKGVPQPLVEFYHESTRITSSSRVTVEHDASNTHWRIVIKDSTREDFRKYRAEAKNAAGTAISEATVTGQQVPVFEQGLKKTTVSEKETIRMEVKVNGFPNPELKWFKDGSQVIPDGTRIIIKEETLIINESRIEDSGTYTVEATNSAGKESSTAPVTVEPLSESPKFTEGLKSVSIKESETAEMSVTVSGKPEPEVTWYKDSKPVQVDGTHFIEKKDTAGHHTLIIKDATTQDIGTYSCKATNPAGSAETSASVNVEVQNEPPKFTEVLKSVSIKETESTELSVTVSGKPEPEIKWFKDSQPVQVDGTHFIEKKDTVGHHTLTIRDARQEDIGTYSCRATNVAGSAECSASVDVEIATEGPKFTETLKSVSIKETEFTTLSVTVTGKPEPQISWFKDDQPIQIDGTHFIEKKVSIGQHTLTIRDARLTDLGTYSCKATNVAGSAETTATVTVLDKMTAPEFTKKLVPIQVKESQSAKFEVTVTGKPEPNISWYKDDQPVQADGTHIMARKDDKGQYSLVISNAGIEDVGVYSCRAVNESGMAETKASFGVQEHLEAPEFTESLKPLEVKESTTAEMSVTVSGKPEPEITWFKDGSLVQIDGSHILEHKDASGHHTLVIKDARMQDAGTYSCKATNKAGSAETKASFGVQEVVEAPHFTEALMESEVAQGEEAKLECTVVGKPAPEIVWKKDGVPVNVDQSHIISKKDEQGHQVLVIKNVASEDVGAYSCEAVNKAGKAETSAPLKFPKYGFERPEEGVIKPFFVEPLKSTEAVEGDTVILECRVNKESAPEVRWFHNSQEIVPGPNVVIEKLDDGTLRLKIQKTTHEDLGAYKCEAVNKAGKADTQAKLDLKHGEEKEAKITEEEVKPMFIEPLHETTVTEGSTVTMECIVNEASHPTIQWFKDEKPVQLGDHVLVEQTDDGKLKITIQNATKEDVGSYRCEAVNKAGTATTSAALKLQYAEEKTVEHAEEGVVEEIGALEQAPEEVVAESLAGDSEAKEKAIGRCPPEFVELLRSATSNVGGTAVLKCKVKGEPRPKLKWTKDGKEVEMSARITTTYAEDGSIELKVENVTKNDDGEYRCEASNELGTAWTEGPITVADEGALPSEGEAPDFLQPVRPVTVTEGETAVLEGKISGKPEPKVKWYKNQVELKPDDRVKIESLPDGTQKLTIKNATMADMDEYRCEASNDYGDVWSDVTLTVKVAQATEPFDKAQVAPTFVKTLEEVRATEGDHVEMECKIVGEPMPEIRWYKDKEEISSTDAHFHQTTKSDGTARLTIDSVELADAGEYRCEAKNPAGTARTEAPMKVATAGEEPLLTEIAPEFAKELKAVQAKEDEEAVFECKISGMPQPQVKWFKDGEELKPGDGIVIEVLDDGTNRLKIQNAKVDDQGNYRVEATNNAGSMSSKAPLSVTAAEKLKLKKGLEDQKVVVGARIRLSIEVEGKPKTVKWFKGTEEVVISSLTKIEKVTDEEYKLEIEKSQLSDGGAYRVVLSTDTESIESSCQVTVTSGDVKPSFAKGLEDETVPKGSALVLEIEVDGKPKQVKWFMNGSPVDESRAKVEDLGNGKYRLTIPEMGDSDFGDYSVTVSNDAGEVSSKAKVTVAEGKPELVSGLAPTTVKEGEDVKFEVKTKGPVKQVKWYKNGDEIKDAETKDLGNGTYQLLIPSAKKSDAAEYKVVLSNDAGSVDSSAGLKVEESKPKEEPKEEKAAKEPLGFVKGLEDQTVKPGDKAVLEVQTNGKPKQVKWYKNGKEISPSDHAEPKQVSDAIYQLVIPDATKDDSADYKIVVTDDDGVSADSSCALTVKLPGKISIVKGLEDQTVPPGVKVILEVEVDRAPKQVKWYKNGKEIAPSDKAKPKKADEKRFQLEIPDIVIEDMSDYKVVLTDDDDNTADSYCALTVKLPAKKLGFEKGLEDQIAKPGDKVVLEVETTGKPKQVKWYKNGKEIAPSDKVEPKQVSDTIYQLVIPDTTEDDAADFKVVIADDDDNTADSSCALTVKLPAEQPKFVKGLEDVFIPIGSPLNLEIKTSGSPKIVRWYKNGQEVSPDASAKVKLNKIDDNNYSLTIDKSEVADSGTYQVEIENDAGKAKTIGDVTVEVPIEFLKPLKDVEVKEGEQATFEVETNTKVRKVTWYRNGQEIKTDSRVVTRSEETKYKLLIKSSLKEDAGTYKIVLCNSCGEVDSEAKLTVKKAKGDEPKILKGLEDQVVAKGADLIFEVKVQGEDLELKWFKDGSPVSADAKIEKIDEQTYRLTIPTADLKDAGQYSVDASNDAGKAKSSASGEVDEVPEIVKELEDAEISQDDDQLFRVEVSAPVRQVKWYKNGQEVKPLGNVAQKQVNPKKYELTISKAQMDNAGTFKVVLSNAAGSCESSAQLTVVKPNILKVLKGLQDVTVNDGEPIELSCKVEGTPKTVKWYKNGQEIKPDDRIKMEENPANGEFCLKIPEATASDGAAYRIVLTNDRGEVYSGAVAHVRAKKPEAEAKPANFVSPLSDIEIPEGDTLTLKCQVAGQPEPEVKWFCDGKELTKDDRVTIRLAFDGTATLRIRDTKKSDAGEYHVVASNEAGSSESRCKVGVISAEELPESPKFVIPLRTQGAFPGSKAEFTVKVRGVPKPTLTFYLNGSPVDLNDPRFVLDDMADGNFTLTINEVKEEDYGTIRCVAQNDNGKDECEAKFSESKDKPEKIKDDEGYPPKFNVPLWDRRIPEDQPLSIECHVDAKPVADIRWTKDGEMLQESENVEIWNTPDGACRVKINRFTQFDIGVYKCQAKNCHGVADTRANYNVEVEMVEEKVERKEYPPRFNPQLSDVNVSAGNTISLSCGVDAVPTATVVWYKDGLPIKLDGRVEAEYDEKSGQCRLTIRDAKDSDDGAYRCVATNEHGTTNTACLVGVKSVKEEVKKEGEEPFFTKGLVDTWTERGETIMLKCAVTGDPRPEIKWYRNGILLRDSNRVSLEYAPDGTCTCVVKECSLSDEGIYRCEAENSLGKAKTQATAHIEMGRSKTDKVKLPEGEAPRFVIPLEDMTVTQGSSLELECKVAGQPMPQVKWAKDGAPVWDDPRYEWTTDAAAGTYRLYIREATVYDEGTYRCVATNDSGQATTKAYVKIDDGTYGGVPKESAMTPPRFTLHLGDARATEGQPLKLEAKIEANPLPELTWYKDGEKVLPSDRVTMEMDPDGTARLIIPKCSMDDDGLYRVIATNPAGSAHDKANATVKRAPAGVIENGLPEEDFQANKAPKVIIPLENVKVPEKQRISLRCKFSGDPKPAIKWFKDGERVYAFGRCQMTEDDDGNCELTIDSAGRMDNGCYRCVAENIYGSARTMCEVVVQLKERKPRDFEAELKEGNAPGFSVPLTVKRAKPGDTVTFECVPYGNPFPTIKWMKDGIELNPSSTVKMEVSDDGLQRLILSDIDFFSEGFYRCVATNEHGTASTKAELSVAGDRAAAAAGKKYQPEENGEPQECKPRIRRGLYNQSIHQGNVIDLIVCATGWPTPTVKWYKNGEELKSEGPDGRQVIWTDERGFHHLVILNCMPEDDGDYSLIATNKLGTAKTEGTITVIRPREVKMYDDAHERGGMPFPPGFIRQIKNKHVFSHMPTIFDCLVVGHPAPEVDWYHNGKKIVPGGRVKIQSSGGGSHAIIILDSQPEDAGEYLAVARNCHGVAQSSAILEVTVPHLDTIKFDGSFDITPYLTEEYGFRKLNYASFPTPPDRGPFIKEVTGHYLTLSWIPTKRSPPRYPQVTYVIEIRELPEKEWTLLDFNIPEPVCKVRGLELGKSYQFRVRAENIYGISDPSPASPPSRLMAPPQPVLDKNKRPIPLLDPYAERALDQAYAEQYACAPWFAPGVVDKRFCAENDTLTLTLNVQGFPDPDIQWKFRGWDVDTSSPTSNLRVATYGGSETVLTVHGFTQQNVGQYQCVAKNQYGEAQQNIFVEYANRPNFMQPLQNKVCSSGKPLKLDVRVEGNPFPEIKWLKEWHPLVESSRIKFVQDGPYLCSLIINDPMWRDSGIYSCVAVNDAGKASTSCSVTVEADGEYNDVQLPSKRKVLLEARKVREIYEIDEADEKKAASGAPFHVTERATGKRFMAQLKPLDSNLQRSIQMHNLMLDNPGTVQMHQVLVDNGLAVVIYDGVSGTLLDSLIAPVRMEEDAGVIREEQVQIFMRQLLAALQYMHNKKVAHLDLRPEAVLLQDDHIRLADFGQSRRLLRGRIQGEIQGTPEFVSPEIASCKDHVTLATDMWSAGVLSYVLLSGVSPFLGDSDAETLANVQRAQYTLDIQEFDDISDEAKDFIKRLLCKDPQNRMTVSEALNHPWMSTEPLLKDAKLASDCLREFKYRHKWLERRVFVQQTPSEQLTQLLETPLTTVASSQPQPQAVYDYLRIKDVPINPAANTPEDYGRRPDDFTNRATSPRMGERKLLVPQDKGEAPSSQNGFHPMQKPVEPQVGREPEPHVPMRLVRGEHRDIEEEIANRILSDISEENSIAGSLASLEEYRRLRQRKSRSRSSTPQNDASETSTTPLASPALTIESADPVQVFFGDLDIPVVPEQGDPRIPVGAPLFLEGLGKHHVIADSPTIDRSSLSPRSLPGTKSPVLLSPGREHSMEVIIATKRGKPGKTEPHTEEAKDIDKRRGEDKDERPAKVKPAFHDDDFENLMDEVEKIKQKYKKHRGDLDDLEKYRPKNVLKEQEIEFTRPEIDVDDYPWESHYQIGPDTLLLASRGASFNARVRDYRRQLWGDGAPLVQQGYLGFRNGDITVRERRRYTDLIKEDPNIAKSVEQVERDLDKTQSGAIRRIRQDISKIAPSVSKKADGTFAPIFRQRLRDVCFVDDASELVLECEAMGNPVPQISWFHHESVLTEDGRHEISQEGSTCRLVIKKPQFIDCGEYSCVAVNELGTDKSSARLFNGELPPRPGRPEFEFCSDSELFLQWEAPEMPTSLEGIIYKLEIRPAGENDHFAQWTVISDSVDDEAALVKHLEPHGVYQFRVTAKNGFGWGTPSLTSRAVQTRHRGAPKIPSEELKNLHFNTLTMPQRDRQGKALTEICEEDEELAEEITVASGKEKSLFLNTSEDFDKKFKLDGEVFRSQFSVVRNASNLKSEINSHCVAKIRQATAEASSEFEALKAAQHENVVKLMAAYEKGGFMLLFQERLYENVFDRFIYSDTYNEEQIALSMRQLAAALQWIHFKGIVHLDVQPTNVMFISKRSWMLKLIDFENAQQLDEDLKKPSKPLVQWAAPEVHQPEGVLSVQTDMWGLGIICFCLLSGFHPFSNEDDTERETIDAVKAQKCDPNLIPVQASQEALSFATWALKKNPSRRMRSDEALSHRWLSSDPHMARRREGIKYQSGRLRKTAFRTTLRKRITNPDTKLYDAYGEKKSS